MVYRKRKRNYNGGGRKRFKRGGRPVRRGWRVGGVQRLRALGMRQEKKYIDADHSLDPVPSAGAIFPSLNLIPQGASENERLGRKVWIRDILIRGAVFTTSSAMAQAQCRVIVYCDKQTNGATATVATILEVGGGADYLAFRNLESAGRYKVLHDKTYKVRTETRAGSVSLYDFKTTNFKINLKGNIPILFDGAVGSLTELCCNNVGILVISEAARSQFFAKVRVRYVG